MLDNHEPRKVTEGATFRIGKSNLEELRREAKQKQVSLNTLVNQIFVGHVDWHSNAVNAGMISVPRNLQVVLMKKISDEEITKIAEETAENVPDAILLLRDDYTPLAFLDVVDSWLKVSNLAYKHNVYDDRHTYVIQHDLGKKWSLYLSKVIQYVFEKLISKKPESYITKNTVMFKIDIEKK